MLNASTRRWTAPASASRSAWRSVPAAPTRDSAHATLASSCGRHSRGRASSSANERATTASTPCRCSRPRAPSHAQPTSADAQSMGLKQGRTSPVRRASAASSGSGAWPRAPQLHTASAVPQASSSAACPPTTRRSSSSASAAATAPGAAGGGAALLLRLRPAAVAARAAAARDRSARRWSACEVSCGLNDPTLERSTSSSSCSVSVLRGRKGGGRREGAAGREERQGPAAAGQPRLRVGDRKLCRGGGGRAGRAAGARGEPADFGAAAVPASIQASRRALGAPPWYPGWQRRRRHCRGPRPADVHAAARRPRTWRSRPRPARTRPAATAAAGAAAAASAAATSTSTAAAVAAACAASVAAAAAVRRPVA
jgi:hypothetical protein